jgi:hypothetical protein
LAPSRIEAPIGAEPPVKGPVMASFTVSAASAGRARPIIDNDTSSLTMI